MLSKKRQLSVLHIGKFYPPHRGGIETHLYDLATRQASEAAVEVVVAHDHARTDREILNGVGVTRCATLGVIASMPVCLGMAGEIRRHPADIVHLHTPNPGAALALLLSGHRGKVVVTHHADTMGRRLLRKLSDPFVGAVMDRASAIIVTSSRYLSSSLELWAYQKKCRVVPLAIDPAPFQEVLPESKMVQDRFGARMLLAVGRLVPYKGFRFAIEAMTQVDGHLCIIGSGPEENFLRQLARDINVAEKVTFMSRVDDLRPYYQAACAFVLPSVSRAEAFGVVQLEAMASGTPIVNTRLDSGVPEVGLDGISAITVPPSDATALAAAMNTLLNDRVLSSQLSAGGRRAVQETYGIAKMVSTTLDIYREVLGSTAS